MIVWNMPSPLWNVIFKSLCTPYTVQYYFVCYVRPMSRTVHGNKETETDTAFS